jgi:hypothetical protein
MDYDLQSSTESFLVALIGCSLVAAGLFLEMTIENSMGTSELTPCAVAVVIAGLAYWRKRSFNDVLRIDEARISIVRLARSSETLLQSWAKTSVREIVVATVPESVGG